MATVTVTVNKTKSESSGLYLFQDEQNRLTINSIMSGPFMNTELKSSMQIISINGASCVGMDEGTAVALLDSSGGRVTVIAQEPVYDAVVVDGAPVGVGGPGVSYATTTSTTYTASSTVDDYNNPPPTAPYASLQAQPQNQPPVHVHHTTLVAQSSNATTGNPPPGCSAGGHWRVIMYSGEKTWILCLVLACCFSIYSGCGACAFLCPQDRTNVYVLNGRLYDNTGKFIGMANRYKFVG